MAHNQAPWRRLQNRMILEISLFLTRHLHDAALGWPRLQRSGSGSPGIRRLLVRPLYRGSAVVGRRRLLGNRRQWHVVGSVDSGAFGRQSRQHDVLA